MTDGPTADDALYHVTDMLGPALDPKNSRVEIVQILQSIEQFIGDYYAIGEASDPCPRRFRHARQEAAGMRTLARQAPHNQMKRAKIEDSPPTSAPEATVSPEVEVTQQQWKL